jgi:PEP-CTERM motif
MILGHTSHGRQEKERFMKSSGTRLFGTATALGALVLASTAPAQAAPIAVAGYTYDFSQTDDVGGATVIHPFATDPTNTLLTDGNLGSLALVPFGIQNVAFPNGTWVGFTNHGSGNAYQPRVEFDLGGTFNIDTVEVSYLVENEASIYAPQPVPIDPLDPGLGNLFDALTVATSSDGVTFTDAAFTNNFVLQADDAAAGSFEQRTATVSLGGASASYVSIEIHTPWSFIFLGEVTINEGAPPLVGDLDGDGFVGIADLNIVLGNWNQNVPPGDPLADPSGDGFVGIEDLNTVLGNWNAGTPPASGAAVPEPATLGLLGLGGVMMMLRRRTA